MMNKKKLSDILHKYEDGATASDLQREYSVPYIRAKGWVDLILDSTPEPQRRQLRVRHAYNMRARRDAKHEEARKQLDERQSWAQSWLLEHPQDSEVMGLLIRLIEMRAHMLGLGMEVGGVADGEAQ